MVMENRNTVIARSILTPNSSRNFVSCSHYRGQTLRETRTPLTQPSNQRPIVDLLVAMVAVPVLILCALQLEKNVHNMHNSPESRWLVFALGIGMLVISVIICGYVTHRMGICIWAGPIDEDGNRISMDTLPNINSHNDILRIVDSLPPSYDNVVKCDLPPPPYDCIVIDILQRKETQLQTSTKNVCIAEVMESGLITVATHHI